MLTDPRIFDDDHLPRELKHREAEIGTLSRALEPTLHGESGEHVLIAGPSGVGKTALARHTLQKAQRRAPVETAYCRCVGTTEGDLYRELLREHASAPNPPGNRPLADLQGQLHEVVDAPFVVVLDEADSLPGSGVLRDLLAIPRCSLIAITHEPETWLARAPDRVRRAIGPTVRADRYSTSELADILEARADRGLLPGAVDREQLERIADEVAGVARFGIQALRAAAELASERDHDRIEDVDVADSFERAERRIREANLRSLAFHHQVLYALVHDAEEITGTALHERYDAIADEVYAGRPWAPIGRRARRNKLRKLEAYDLILYAGPNQARVYKPADRSISSPADLPELLAE